MFTRYSDRTLVLLYTRFRCTGILRERFVHFLRCAIPMLDDIFVLHVCTLQGLMNCGQPAYKPLLKPLLRRGCHKNRLADVGIGVSCRDGDGCLAHFRAHPAPQFSAFKTDPRTRGPSSYHTSPSPTGQVLCMQKSSLPRLIFCNIFVCCAMYCQEEVCL